LENINQNIKIKKRDFASVDAYVTLLKDGDRNTLSKVITLLESDLELRRELGMKVLASLSSKPIENTIRIGITGSPGVGKSTFIDSIIPLLTKTRGKIAVLAIDPSSTVSHGSILGDKTRMSTASIMDDVYIRPTPSRNMLGGTAAHTYETMILCEYAGFHTTIIETVGVGQSEIEVDQLCDINILLLQPGAGDDIQGIKRGILEKCDIIVVNKADGQQLELAQRTKNQYGDSVRLIKHNISNWIVPVICASSIDQNGLSEVITAINNFEINAETDNHKALKRRKQEDYYSEQLVKEIILSKIISSRLYKEIINDLKHNKDTLFDRLIDVKSKITELLIKL
jgi:LAO/AO transport system kinase